MKVFNKFIEVTLVKIDTGEEIVPERKMRILKENIVGLREDEDGSVIFAKLLDPKLHTIQIKIVESYETMCKVLQ